MRSFIPATIVGKRPGSQADPERDVHKRPRHMGSTAEGVLRTFMRSTTQGTHVTELDIGYDHGDDVSGQSSPHQTEHFPAHRAIPKVDD